MNRPTGANEMALVTCLVIAQFCGLPPARVSQAFVYHCQLRPAEASAITKQPVFADRYFQNCDFLQELAYGTEPVSNEG